MRGDKTTGFVARFGLRFAMVWASATLGSFGLFSMFFLLFVRFLPTIAMAEVKSVMKH